MTRLGPALVVCRAPQHGTLAIPASFLPAKWGVFAACCTGSADAALAAKHSQVSCRALRRKAVLHFSKGLCCGPWRLFITEQFWLGGTLKTIWFHPAVRGYYSGVYHFYPLCQHISKTFFTEMKGHGWWTSDRTGLQWRVVVFAPGYQLVLELSLRENFCRHFWLVGEQLLYLGHRSVIF